MQNLHLFGQKSYYRCRSLR